MASAIILATTTAATAKKIIGNAGSNDKTLHRACDRAMNEQMTNNTNRMCRPTAGITKNAATISMMFLLLVLLLFSGHGQAMPTFNNKEGRVFFAALLRDADGQNALVPLSDAPMYQLLAASPVVEQQKKRRDLGAHRQPMLAKKYDRNCFFSPVQCTLQQWGDGNQAEEVLLGGGAGRRRRR